ncbi:MAG: AMP-dependent synthetase/ligase [Candidatus Woesearchaeota archaeon]
MRTLQDLVSSLETKEGVAISWNDKILSKDENGKTTQKNDLQQVKFNELYHTINAYSRGLIELGLKKGDSIAIISGNNPQWINLSLGANNTGIIDIPMYDTATPKELKDIIEHSRPKVLIVEDKKVWDKIDMKNHPDTKHIFSIRDIEGLQNILSLKRIGENSTTALFNAEPDDIAGRLYTSGTTGNPKGVQLSHYNLVSDFMATQNILTLLDNTDKGFSFLPASHSFERGHKYITLYKGMNTFYSNIYSLKSDLKEQKPALGIFVPIMLDKSNLGFLDKVNEKKMLWLYNIVFPAALDYHKHDFNIKSVIEYVPYKIGDALFFSKVREAFGGKLKYLVTGSAALKRKTEDFFIAAGLDPQEGFGMTETSPVITARRKGMRMFYSVGIPIEGVEVRITNPETGEILPKGVEGEIQTKGPNVMKGYYNNEEETKKVFTLDGYLKTGDLGVINNDKHGTLKVTGRIKELTKVSNGEYINLLSLEEALGKSQYVDTAVVVAEDSLPRPGALFLPNYDKLREYFHKIGKFFDENNPMKNLYEDFKTKKKVPEVDELFSNHINESVNKNKDFKPHEKIGAYEFIDEIPRTPTLKIKRPALKEQFKETIDYLYKKIHRDKS